MRYRAFGRTGLKVSALGFGCWPMAGDRYGAIEDDEAIKAIHRALDRGVNCVDTALEGAVDGHDGLVVLDGPVTVAGHRPAAEAHHGHLQSGPAERSVAHRQPRGEISAPHPGARRRIARSPDPGPVDETLDMLNLAELGSNVSRLALPG